VSASLPVTPLTPLRGACPLTSYPFPELVACTPHRSAPARCLHAAVVPFADSDLRGIGATDSE